ncbi:MAG TPA: UDP-2,4-diacetamido-2,4,6-trideoxy-beta-L-altropyranose hydrolase [Thermoanaerobaculia bacterium]|jgi:UDP-2,4-diacetamido-2,4,6-trideoxy-beta-L-altropyranose hydrolase
MTALGSLLVRVEADAQGGTGHAMRCLALAQAWQDAAGGPVRFLMTRCGEGLATRLRREGILVEGLEAAPGSEADAAQTLAAARAALASWIVVDGYWAGAGYARTLRGEPRRGPAVLFVDDLGEAGPYSADIVLNQNLYAEQEMYADRAPHTGLLLGADFALLRREFAAYRGFPRTIPEEARHLLVTLGGSDPADLTRLAVRALARSDGIAGSADIRVLVGPENPRGEALRAEAAKAGLAQGLLSGVEDVPGLLAWSDLAVTAAGSTCWELAFLGVPALTIAVAPNQRPIAESLSRAGIARDLGWHADVNEESLARAVGELARDRAARTRLSEAGRRLVDGAGAERVVRRLATAKAA